MNPAFSPENLITILNGLVIELYQMERKELFCLLLQKRRLLSELITQMSSGFRCLAKEFLCFSYLGLLQNFSWVFEVSVIIHVNKECDLEMFECI